MLDFPGEFSVVSRSQVGELVGQQPLVIEPPDTDEMAASSACLPAWTR
jgi:hypothetical protein